MDNDDEAMKRYHDAAHAMQSGVALDHRRGSEDGKPKHLRTGVNSALSNISGLAQLLIAKGLITESEYIAAIADAMEQEQAIYELRLGVSLR